MCSGTLKTPSGVFSTSASLSRNRTRAAAAAAAAAASPASPAEPAEPAEPSAVCRVSAQAAGSSASRRVRMPSDAPPCAWIASTPAWKPAAHAWAAAASVRATRLHARRSCGATPPPAGVVKDREIANQAPPPDHQTTEPTSQTVISIGCQSVRQWSSFLSLRTGVRA
jgi:hypothetical protein